MADNKTDSLNDDFELDTPPTEEAKAAEAKAAEEAKAKAKAAEEAKAAKAKAAKAAKAKAAKAAKAKFIDPEKDRKNWPTIIVEMERGKPNYEYVSAHGTMKNGQPFGHDLQIMRGKEVQVPPSIVYALQDSISTHYIQVRDPVTGKRSLMGQDRSGVPWRLIKGGKYCS